MILEAQDLSLRSETADRLRPDYRILRAALCPVFSTLGGSLVQPLEDFLLSLSPSHPPAPHVFSDHYPLQGV